MKILLLEGIHPGAKTSLEEAGFEVDCETGALDPKELAKRLQSYQGVGIRSKTKLTEEILSQNSQLEVIGCFCIGTNQVDLTMANQMGIPVFNAPYSNTRSVAELVIAEMISLSRRLGLINAAAHKGVWKKSAAGNREVRGKTLGIIGYGHIGTQVSVLAEAMGLNVLYYDIVKKLPIGNASPVDSLDELLSQSDFVTLHVPETSMTKNMIGKSQFQQMKKGAFFINASRGTVVVIEDLVSSLKSGHIGGTAIDVFPAEPKNNQEEFESPLRGMENVILTPHIGGSTEEAQVAIGGEVSESLKRYLLTGSTFGAVNFPQLDPPTKRDRFRFSNVHKNVPGVMSQINSLVSESGANIAAQYLATDPKIGLSPR
ncbi:MAG: phosphoglycerate dehydrogenase [Pseudomonadota bacterium]